MAAGWIGQMVGCAVGYPAELKFSGTIVPRDRIAERLDDFGNFNSPEINRSYGQDDVYVEITFLETLRKHGLDVTPRQAGIDFACSKYPLWCANDAGRNNLRKGIAPPDSGHPANTKRCNDIDYQIECDFAGLISPGLPRRVIKLSHVFGAMMNYGDGVWAGQFVGAMYAEAFFTTDRRQIVRAALKAIPMQSQYAGMVYDTLYRYEKFMVAGGGKAPKDAWMTAHAEAVKRFGKNGKFLKDSNGDIDVRLNGAMMLIGFLYGEGDPARTVEIAARCGYDSDCNPSTAAGILFTTIGLNRLAPMWYAGLARNLTFWSTDYTFQKLVETTRALAMKAVVAEGGRIEEKDGKTTFVIPVAEPVPDPYKPSWEPAPPTGARFTPEEMSRIAAVQSKDAKK